MSPLFAEIRAVLDTAEAEAVRAERAARRLPRARADALDQWIHLTAMASGIEHAYSGLEQAFKIIAAEIDGAVPTADDWHARLCALMFTPVPGRRPAVLPAALRSELDDLRAFRHRVRNLYGSELAADVVKEKAARAPATVAKVRSALRAFESAVTRPPGRRKPSRRV
ncbi:MAG: hypothetical protein EPO27_16740 [Betaproteobacteria bacterium]|nr:MAG: hypothetical protein EPO27_16740 [Betaproteobacteria bacterium]